MVAGSSAARDVTADEADEGSPPKKGAQHSGKLLVRMPATLHDELAHAAEREGVSLNQLITGVLAGAVGWGTPEERVELGRAAAGREPDRVTRIALAANLAAVLIAAIAAIVLLVVAWQTGW
jgi:hypothetical protein